MITARKRTKSSETKLYHNIEMPNITTRIGQYCTIHRLVHKEEYLGCDFCNEHMSFIIPKYRYYNYGFSYIVYYYPSKLRRVSTYLFKDVD